MTPPPAKAGSFVAAGAVVLDHHRGAKELVARFGELGAFADEDEEPGASGAVLFSLRSNPGAELTALQVAKAAHGGGHHHAAGFTLLAKLAGDPVHALQEALCAAYDRSFGACKL